MTNIARVLKQPATTIFVEKPSGIRFYVYEISTLCRGMSPEEMEAFLERFEIEAAAIPSAGEQNQ